MSQAAVDVAIIGAGPYGLSLAAHLRKSGRSLRIFGKPMKFWSQHMPRGMRLKSEGFASSLYEPDGEFTLRHYCAEKGIDYEDIGLPVSLETFVAYAVEFQKRYVPMLEDGDITSVTPHASGFELTTQAGEHFLAKQVVVATGIVNFAHLPPMLASLPPELISHTTQHNDPARFTGRRVAVVGGGASAVDMAALLGEAGAEVHLVARRPVLKFHDKPVEPRPLIDRLKAPRSGLGTGWRSRLCTDIPTVFHALPQALRLRAVERHLGPAPCWHVRDMVTRKVRTHLSATLSSVRPEGAQARLEFSQPDGTSGQLDVDHVIGGTGFKVSMERLSFLDKTLQSRIQTVEETPILDRHFQSSVPGLYFVGAAAANSFGPMLRFAFGANFAAKRVSRRLAQAA